MGGCSRRLPTAVHLLASVEGGVQDVLRAAVGFVSCSLRVGDWGILMSLVLDVHEMSWEWFFVVASTVVREKAFSDRHNGFGIHGCFCWI